MSDPAICQGCYAPARIGWGILSGKSLISIPRHKLYTRHQLSVHSYVYSRNINNLPDMNVDEVAQLLNQARHSGTRIEQAYSIATIDDAYQIQSSISSLHRGAVLGWKIGATTEAALQTLNLDKPFHGPLHAPFHQNHTDTNSKQVEIHPDQPTIIETEFVVGLAEDLPPSGTVTAEDVASCTAWIAPGFELVGTRFRMELPGNGYPLIADSAGNIGTIVGKPCTDWQSLDLDAHPATLQINSEQRATGHSGQSIAGNPLGMVAWLANDLAQTSRSLQAGQCIFCGTCSGMIAVNARDKLHADMGALGSLSITLANK